MMGIDMTLSHIPQYKNTLYYDLEFIQLYKVEYDFCGMKLGESYVLIANTKKISELLYQVSEDNDTKKFKSIYVCNSTEISELVNGIKKSAKFLRKNFIKASLYDWSLEKSKQIVMDSYKAIVKSGLKDGVIKEIAVIHPVQLDDTIIKSKESLIAEMTQNLVAVLNADPELDKVLLAEKAKQAINVCQ